MRIFFIISICDKFKRFEINILFLYFNRIEIIFDLFLLSWIIIFLNAYFLSLKNKASSLNNNEGVVYVGNPQILKDICPGVFGTIKPVGYCMIGQKWKKL